MANSQLLLAGTAGTSVMFAAPVGTVLPTDPTTALAAAFKDVGYLSQDGPGISHNVNTNPVNAYGTTLAVRVLQQGRTDTANVTMLEYLNPVAQAIYNKLPLTGTGSIVVTAAAASGSYSYTQGQTLVTQYAMVFHIVDGLNLVRKVLPLAEVQTPGDESFNSSNVSSLQVGITAYPDTAGNSVYTYVVATALKI